GLEKIAVAERRVFFSGQAANGQVRPAEEVHPQRINRHRASERCRQSRFDARLEPAERHNRRKQERRRNQDCNKEQTSKAAFSSCHRTSPKEQAPADMLRKVQAPAQAIHEATRSKLMMSSTA